MKIVKFYILIVAVLLVAAFGLMSCLHGGTLTAITVTPANATVAKGTKTPFIATAIFSDGTSLNWTTAVSWESSDTTVALVSNVTGSQGFVTSVNKGTTTITATDLSNGFSGSTNVTVSDALTMIVTPAEALISRGTTTQFTAKETFADGTELDLTTLVFWESSNTEVATISNAEGTHGLAVSSLATGTTGTTIITATDLVTNVTGSATLVVQ